MESRNKKKRDFIVVFAVFLDFLLLNCGIEKYKQKGTARGYLSLK